MKNFNSRRVFERNDRAPNTEGRYVLYWMQINKRLEYNYALEYAVGWANKLELPLVIHEDLQCDYPWACDRFHYFLMQGMAETMEQSRRQLFSYWPMVVDEPGKGEGVIDELARDAAVVVTDEYPVYFMRERNEQVPQRLEVPYYSVDSNGLIPLQMTDKAPYNAYFFRKIMQRNFIEAYTHPPTEKPLEDLDVQREVLVPEELSDDIEQSRSYLEDIPSLVRSLNIRHDVDPLEIKGTRRAALDRLDAFVNSDLLRYDEDRNDPDKQATSRLSPWLHFGKISEYEIVKAVLERQPEGWDLDDITFNKGSTGGFFNGDANIDGYLDEVITWREVGFHFAHHTPNYNKFESLPDWVLKTLDEHRDDPREYIYSFEQFEQARTHDPLWNAAQRQLKQEGIIHNYLRMLWGKKVIEWTPNPETALDYLIELNNQYAIDGRDPNSYSGIFWCLGRFDRPWQERPIFGKIRYMTSKSTRKKVKLDAYLKKFGDSNQGELL